MKIRIRDLRSLLREAAEQLTLPGVSQAKASTGDPKRDADREMRQLRQRKEELESMKGGWVTKPPPVGELRAEWQELRTEYLKVRKRLKELQDAQRRSRRAPEPEKWKRYGGDPRKNPRGLGS